MHVGKIVLSTGSITAKPDFHLKPAGQGREADGFSKKAWTSKIGLGAIIYLYYSYCHTEM